MTVSIAMGFDQCIDRRLVHRSTNASVFLTSVRQQNSSMWELGVQVPRFTAAAAAKRQRIPLLHGAEVLRQCGIAVTHTGYHIPLGYAFTIQDIAFAWHGEVPARFPAFGPFEGTATIEVAEHYQRNGVTAGLQLHLTLHNADGLIAEGGGLLRCLTPDQYRMLRRRAPLPDAIEQRHDPAPLRDVRREGSTLSGVLGWNHTDPFTFDHFSDHVPGIGMIQSAIYAAEQLAQRPVAGISMSFTRFTEFSPAPMIHARIHSSEALQVEVLQGGEVTATAICHAGA